MNQLSPLMCLWAVLLLTVLTSCTQPVQSFSLTSTCTSSARSSTQLFADADEAASSSDSTPSPQRNSNQAQYGKELEMPSTYVRCGRCQTMYALTEADLGERGKGRRLECTVCSHSWFQSKDRLMDLNQKEGFELVERPDYEIDRVKLNIRENKAPNFQGSFKVYVGNIAFECDEQDIYEAFSEVGNVGDVALVKDDIGRNRGFGFVTMRTDEEGQAAIDKLDGSEIKGRNIAVRPSNN